MKLIEAKFLSATKITNVKSSTMHNKAAVKSKFLFLHAMIQIVPNKTQYIYIGKWGPIYL